MNRFPLDIYARWRFELSYSTEGGSAPHLASNRSRQRQRNAGGQLVGAISHSAALPPLIPLLSVLTPDDHFQLALHWGSRPLPTEGLPVVDDDLMFAASFTTWTGSSLRQLRGSAITTLRQLQRRWQPVTKQLRKFQTAAISKATAQRDVGFTALLVLLVNWSNTLQPYGLIAGLPAVGYSISSRQVEVPLGSRSDISAPMMSGFHISYVAHILPHLRDFLHELQGCILVCICAHHKCCEADIFGLGVSALLPRRWFRNFSFPFVKDLVNSNPINLYTHWRFHAGRAPLAPVHRRPHPWLDFAFAGMGYDWLACSA